MEGRHDVVPHRAHGHGELAPVSTLLLNAEGKPRVAEPVAHPDEVGTGTDEGRRQRRTAGRPVRRPRDIVTACPHLDGHAAPAAARQPVGRRRRPGLRPRPTTTVRCAPPGTRPRSTAAAWRRSRPAPASRPEGPAPGATRTGGPVRCRPGRAGPGASRPAMASSALTLATRTRRRSRAHPGDVPEPATQEREQGEEPDGLPSCCRVAVLGDRQVPAGVPGQQPLVDPADGPGVVGSQRAHPRVGHDQRHGHHHPGHDPRRQDLQHGPSEDDRPAPGPRRTDRRIPRDQRRPGGLPARPMRPRTPSGTAVRPRSA